MLTILDNPQLFSPTYNDIAFVVDSTNKANCNFRYVAELYVNDVLATTIKLFPNTEDGYCVFRLNRVLENYVSMDRHSGLIGCAPNPNSIVAYAVKFMEESDGTTDCSNGNFVLSNDLISSVYYTWNAALSYTDFADFNHSQWLPMLNQTVQGQEEVFNGPMDYLSGGWPYFNNPSANGFGLRLVSGGVLRFNCVSAPFSATAASLVTFLTDGVDYDFSFNINAGAAVDSIVLTFGTNIVWSATALAAGTYNITGTGTCGSFDNGEIKFFCDTTAIATVSFDNLSVKTAITEAPGTWRPRRLLSGQAYHGAVVPIHPGEESFISFLQYKNDSAPDEDVNAPNTVQFRFFDTAGDLLTEVYADLPAECVIDTSSPDYPYDQVEKFMVTVGTGMRNVSELLDVLAPDDFGSYEVSVGRKVEVDPGVYTYGAMTESVYYRYYKAPTRYETTRLEWLGRLGNMESYSFRLRDTRSVGSDFLEYTKIAPTFRDGAFRYDVGDRGRTVLNNNVTERRSALSEYMTEEEARWLEELFTSTSVVKQIPAKYLCFSVGTGSTFTAPTGHGLYTGDSVLVMDTLDVEDVIDTTVTDVDGDSVTLADALPGLGPWELMVRMPVLVTSPPSTYVAPVLPVVVTSKEWVMRDKKGKSKNISYTIEYEMAYATTIQRG